LNRNVSRIETKRTLAAWQGFCFVRRALANLQLNITEFLAKNIKKFQHSANPFALFNRYKANEARGEFGWKACLMATPNFTPILKSTQTITSHLPPLSIGSAHEAA